MNTNKPVVILFSGHNGDDYRLVVPAPDKPSIVRRVYQLNFERRETDALGDRHWVHASEVKLTHDHAVGTTGILALALHTHIGAREVCERTIEINLGRVYP